MTFRERLGRHIFRLLGKQQLAAQGASPPLDPPEEARNASNDPDFDLSNWPLVNGDKPALCERWEKWKNARESLSDPSLLEFDTKCQHTQGQCCWGCAIAWHIMEPATRASRQAGQAVRVSARQPYQSTSTVALEYAPRVDNREQVIISGIQGQFACYH